MSLFLIILFISTSLSFAAASTVLDIDNTPVRKEPSLPSSATNGLNTYIIHVQWPPAASTLTSISASDDGRERWYRSFLPASTASVQGHSRLVYSYKSVIDGFAARLTDEELAELEKKPGFVHAYQDRILHLQTTHSPDFLGLRRGAAGFWSSSKFGKGVIIGMLDTGVLPSHPSFRDEGMPPPPAKWKGACEFNASLCNNKLIGARAFISRTRNVRSNVTDHKAKARDGPLDDNGHGTHTASTAAGAFVENAAVNGLAKGTAVGMAPLAHLAIYKVCTMQGCLSSDILAGMDAAVVDGVDIISISIGGGGSVSFYNDPIAIGAFGAMQKGVFVSAAAGNSGPFIGSINNDAPWLLTVGAGTMDRSIRATVKLGNNSEFYGESAYQPKSWSAKMLPLIYPVSDTFDTLCSNVSLASIDVKGKIVLCDSGAIPLDEKGRNVLRAGGVGMIIANLDIEAYTIPAVAHVLPASHVSYLDGLKIKAYINSSQSPKATIAFGGTLLGVSPAPVVASFSSRGPSFADPTILKPDIIGPGVNILAAWAFDMGLEPPSKFVFDSGTSMATPHLSGIAALLKSAHPDWSPAAIKSAIMTTASVKGNDGNPIAAASIFDQDQGLNLKPADLFALGAGHVDPSKASNPGLIYDITPDDYAAHLCGLGYSNKLVNAIARSGVNCKSIRKRLNSDLNYPSFMVTLSQTNFYSVTVSRTVTNVGAPGSVYTVQVTHPERVAVRVQPKRLVFSKTKQKAQFSVTFTGRGFPAGGVFFPQGHLTWVSSDKSITVNSPIQVSLS